MLVDPLLNLLYQPSESNSTQLEAAPEGLAYPLPSDAALLWTGFLLSGSIFLGAALLELTVLGTVKEIISTDDGRKLYVTAWLYNVINHLILAPIVYLVGTKVFGTAAPSTLTQRAMYISGVLAVHSLGYYFTHRAMHTKALWWAHRFHHKFNKYICPIAASAVTQTEYLIAYLIPFIVSGAVMRPLPMEAFSIAGLLIGHINNFLHTPWMEELSAKHSPWWWVGASDHFEHHRQLTNNYAAPTFNVDRVLGLWPALDVTLGRACDSLFGGPIGHPKKPADAHAHAD